MKISMRFTLSELLPAIGITIVLGLAFWLMYHGLRTIVNISDQRQSAPVVLETRLGLEVEYKGHKIIYTGLTHNRLGSNALTIRWSDDINLNIDGRQLTLSPGAYLEEVPVVDYPLYAFFLPDGEELFLKEASKDGAVLRWTDKDWSK